jgi:hypothetical protein
MSNLRRLILMALVALQFVAATPAAHAEIEIPSCYPCGR